MALITLLIIESVAIVAIVGWMIRKRMSSPPDPGEQDEKKPARKLEDALELPKEEHWD